MKRTLALFAAALAALTLCSCGHNIVQYSKGIGMDIGVNPETYMISINLKYGEIVNAVVKEKTKVNYSGETTVLGSVKGTVTSESSDTRDGSTTTTTGAKFYLETGDQVTGYVVDLEKVKQEKK